MRTWACLLPPPPPAGPPPTGACTCLLARRPASPQVPCDASGAPQLLLGGCLLRLPLSPQGALGLVHFVRDPWATVVSAYHYHMQEPPPEPWLDAPVRPGA